MQLNQLNVVQTGPHVAVANVPSNQRTKKGGWPMADIEKALRAQYGVVTSNLRVKTALRGFGADRLFLTW